MERESYTSDLTVEQYEIIASFLPVKMVTAPRQISYHEIINAILYRLKNGCSWKDLPHDFPDHKTVFHYFNAWTKEGVWDKILEELNTQNRLSQKKQVSNPPSL